MLKAFTNMRSLNGIMSEAINLFEPGIKRHHDQTAYLAFLIARDLGFDVMMQQLTIFSAITHDIGLIMLEKPSGAEGTELSAKELAHSGAKLTSRFVHSDPVPAILEHSQDSWTEILQLPVEKIEKDYQNARISSIVHLSDTVSKMIRKDLPILNQAKQVRKDISQMRGTEFSEEAVDSFLRVTGSESVWMDFRYHPEFVDQYAGTLFSVPLKVAVALTKDTSLIVDYRSAFTATHSAGVAASATALARYAGMSSDECKMMQIAGNLHDIGKLMVPRSILEKPGKLTEEEFNIIKEHPYFTHLILKNVDGFERIANWAGFHHEKLNGTGYPFRYGADMLDTGARIMAVADIFSAIAEVRPYRMGMNREQALSVLNENVKNGGIDGDLVALLSEHYNEIDELRETAARAEGARYYEAVTKEEIDELRATAARAESAGYDSYITQEELESLRKDTTEGFHGAMDVEYGQFAKQFTYVSNLEKRFSHPFKLIVVSLDLKEGETPHPEELEECMFYMEHCIQQTIRNVDILTKYGKQQFLIILLGTETEGAKIAVERVFHNYEKMHGSSPYAPSYFIADTEDDVPGTSSR